MKKLIVMLAFLVVATASAFAQDDQAKAIALSNQADSLYNQDILNYGGKTRRTVYPKQLNAEALALPGISFELYQDLIEHRNYARYAEQREEVISSGEIQYYDVESEIRDGNYDFYSYFPIPSDIAYRFLDTFKQKAEEGNTDAMATLAYLYVGSAKLQERELTVPNPKKPKKSIQIKVNNWYAPDDELAVERYQYWINKAVEAGNRSAMYKLGMEYIYGVKEIQSDTIVSNKIRLVYDYDKGIKLIEKASDAGNFNATILLQSLYADKDKDKSNQYFLKSIELAKKNHYHFYFWDLANKLEDAGRYNEAVNLYESLAPMEYFKVLKRLGNIYEGVYVRGDGRVESKERDGITVDLKKAKEYYTRANDREGLSRVNSAIEEKTLGKQARIYTTTRKKYGRMFWKNGNLVNESGKVIIPARKYEKIYLETDVVIVKDNNKYGAVTYKGTQIIAPKHNKFEGTGTKEGRLVFSDNTTNGVKIFIYSTSGQLVASRAFTNSQVYSMVAWMRDWLININNPVYSD
jgi:TPR repeat protein